MRICIAFAMSMWRITIINQTFALHTFDIDIRDIGIAHIRSIIDLFFIYSVPSGAIYGYRNLQPTRTYTRNIFQHNINIEHVEERSRKMLA